MLIALLKILTGYNNHDNSESRKANRPSFFYVCPTLPANHCHGDYDKQYSQIYIFGKIIGYKKLQDQ